MLNDIEGRSTWMLNTLRIRFNAELVQFEINNNICRYKLQFLKRKLQFWMCRFKLYECFMSCWVILLKNERLKWLPNWHELENKYLHPSWSKIRYLNSPKADKWPISSNHIVLGKPKQNFNRVMSWLQNEVIYYDVRRFIFVWNQLPR